jgi:hypothetical protein
MFQNKRPSFLLYKSFYSPVKHLKDDDLGLLFRTIFEYQNGLEIKDLPSQVGMAFAFFKNQFDLDEQKYQVVLKRNKSNGSKGGRPKKEETQANPENPLGFYEPRKGETDKETETEIDTEIKKEPIKEAKKKLIGFIPPTLQEVQDYCKSRNSAVSANKFFDYYSTGNWKDAKGNQVKNWKQKLLTWESKYVTTKPVEIDSFCESLNKLLGQNLIEKLTENQDSLTIKLFSASSYDKWEEISAEVKNKIKALLDDKFGKKITIKF